MKITRVFLDVHMGLEFEGLGKIAKESKTKIDEGSVVVFLNRANTAFKLMVGGKYITYFRNGNKRMPIEAIRYLPETFGGTRMEFDQAVRKSLSERLGLS